MKRIARGSSGSDDGSPPRRRLQEGDGPARDRGASPLLGMVLLVGIVAIGSVGILVLGGTILEDTQDRAGDERARLAFQQFDSQVHSVAVSNDATRQIDVSLPESSDGMVRKEDSGRVVVTRYDGTTTEVVNRSIGSVVYEGEKTNYAYEAGAVWRGQGAGTRIVSAPDLTYRNSTLTLPITDLNGDQRIADGDLRLKKNRTVSPLNDVTMVRGELITVKVTSEYYGGWAEYFRQHIDGVTVLVDHSTETVTIHLAEPVIDGSLDTGLVAAGDIHATNPSTEPSTGVKTTGTVYGTIDGNTESNVASLGVEPIDATVEVRAEAAKQNGTNVTISGGETLTAGVYYVDDDTYLDGTSDVTVDLSSGDVTIVMDGNMGLKNTNLDVINGASSGNTARVFFNHSDMAVGNSAGVSVESDESKYLQIYGTSDMMFSMGQANNDGFTGVVYAPRTTDGDGDNEAVNDMNLDNAECGTDICLSKGSGEVTGAIVGGDMTIDQNANFTYDQSLEDVEPSVDKSGYYPPPITFLHVTVNEVDVRD